jgi:hypothetical protein
MRHRRVYIAKVDPEDGASEPSGSSRDSFGHPALTAIRLEWPFGALCSRKTRKTTVR